MLIRWKVIQGMKYAIYGTIDKNTTRSCQKSNVPKCQVHGIARICR